MIEQVAIDEFLGHVPPTYRSQIDGRPVKITLDSSAIIKLGGAGSYRDMIAFLASKRDDIATAARRVIALRQFNASMDELAVTIFALDLD